MWQFYIENATVLSNKPMGVCEKLIMEVHICLWHKRVLYSEFSILNGNNFVRSNACGKTFIRRIIQYDNALKLFF